LTSTFDAPDAAPGYAPILSANNWDNRVLNSTRNGRNRRENAYSRRKLHFRLEGRSAGRLRVKAGRETMAFRLPRDRYGIVDDSATPWQFAPCTTGRASMPRLRVSFALGLPIPNAGLGVLFAAFVGTSTVAAAELPPGPNRDLVNRECQACHDIDMVVDAAGASRSDWSATLEAMTGYGLSVTPEDRTKILDYLATALGPKAAGR
jgi:hypothetical protein